MKKTLTLKSEKIWPWRFLIICTNNYQYKKYLVLRQKLKAEILGLDLKSFQSTDKKKQSYNSKSNKCNIFKRHAPIENQLDGFERVDLHFRYCQI